jgi:hypothetical protein
MAMPSAIARPKKHTAHAQPVNLTRMYKGCCDDLIIAMRARNSSDGTDKGQSEHRGQARAPWTLSDILDKKLVMTESPVL